MDYQNTALQIFDVFYTATLQISLVATFSN